MSIVRKLGFSLLMLGLTLPAWSVDRPGTISGYVRAAGGSPQMGAAVEVLGAAAQRSQSIYRREWFLLRCRAVAWSLQSQNFRACVSTRLAGARWASCGRQHRSERDFEHVVRRHSDHSRAHPRRKRRLEMGAAFGIEPADLAAGRRSIREMISLWLYWAIRKRAIGN